MQAPDEQSASVQQRDLLFRAVQVLTALVDLDDDAVGVRALSDVLGRPPSSVHRVLGRLEDLGMVTRRPGGRYELGLEFYRLAWRSTNRFSLNRAAAGPLQELATACNESAFLGVYNDARRQMMLATTVDSDHPLRYVLELGRWVPLHAGASGLAILAFLPDVERRSVVEAHDLQALTTETIRDPHELEKQMARVRERGYAITTGQRIHGAVGIAAPIFASGARVVGDIGITVPEQRFQPDMEKRYAVLVKRAAAHVGSLLGGVSCADG